MRFNKTQLSTGLRIHYAESGDTRGTPVVFVHGWPDSWFSFSRVLPLLPATLRLIALDQRGFGESDRQRGQSSSRTARAARSHSRAVRA